MSQTIQEKEATFTPEQQEKWCRLALIFLEAKHQFELSQIPSDIYKSFSALHGNAKKLLESDSDDHLSFNAHADLIGAFETIDEQMPRVERSAKKAFDRYENLSRYQLRLAKDLAKELGGTISLASPFHKPYRPEYEGAVQDAERIARNPDYPFFDLYHDAKANMDKIGWEKVDGNYPAPGDLSR